MNSGQGAGSREAELLMMPGGWGWGIAFTALAPVTELMTRCEALWQKIHEVMIRRGWGTGVRSQNWRSCHMSATLFSPILKDSMLLCTFFILVKYNYHEIYHFNYF